MTKKKPSKKKGKKICMTTGQIKTIIDEAREGGICDGAADLIVEIDEEFEKPKKKSKKKKSFIERWF